MVVALLFCLCQMPSRNLGTSSKIKSGLFFDDLKFKSGLGKRVEVKPSVFKGGFCRVQTFAQVFMEPSGPSALQELHREGGWAAGRAGGKLPCLPQPLPRAGG
jgi:hypothetical protein